MKWTYFTAHYSLVLELAYDEKGRAYRGVQHALVGELVPFVVETGGRLRAKSLRSLKELVGGAVREQMTRGSLESVGDVEAEVEAQCAKLCRRIGDEVRCGEDVRWRCQSCASVG